MFEITSAISGAIRQATGAPPPAPFAWHDRETLVSLLAPHGFAVGVSRHQLAWTAPSAREFLDQEASNHPMAVASLTVLEQAGQAETLRARLLAILEDGNEDPGGFLITSPYVIATAIRDPVERHR